MSRVVFYCNGVGYVERRSGVDGDTRHLKVRWDDVNDLLKSLTVIECISSKAVNMSIFLDPGTLGECRRC